MSKENPMPKCNTRKHPDQWVRLAKAVEQAANWQIERLISCGLSARKAHMLVDSALDEMSEYAEFGGYIKAVNKQLRNERKPLIRTR